jgi:hypothetical protein
MVSLSHLVPTLTWSLMSWSLCPSGTHSHLESDVMVSLSHLIPTHTLSLILWFISWSLSHLVPCLTLSLMSWSLSHLFCILSTSPTLVVPGGLNPHFRLPGARETVIKDGACHNKSVEESSCQYRPETCPK